MAAKSRPARLLLAEDNRVNQLVALAQLESLGHHVTVVNNGADAIEAVRKDEFDMVLMDIQMPVMDGIEATRRIRALEDPSKSRVTIIALTANAMKGNAENYLAAGMDDYMSKPIDRSELRTLLEKWLK